LKTSLHVTLYYPHAAISESDLMSYVIQVSWGIMGINVKLITVCFWMNASFAVMILLAGAEGGVSWGAIAGSVVAVIAVVVVIIIVWKIR
jgi:hypothetical protein